MPAPYDNLPTAIFNQVSGAIGVLRTASIKKHDDAWTWFTLNLDTLKDVVTAHITAINVVVEPIVAEDDLEKMVTSYRALKINLCFGWRPGRGHNNLAISMAYRKVGPQNFWNYKAFLAEVSH